MITLNNITFSYDLQTQVLENFHLNIKPGEIVAIQGKSGQGKSTILRIIAGLEQPISGEVLIDGENVSNIPTNKRRVGFVFQNHALFPHLTIRKNIEYGLYAFSKQEKTDLVNEISEKVEIKDLLERYPHEISGGQKQRVAIARSLVLKPSVLLLDEPFTALDQELKDAIRKDIKKILEMFEITTLLVTHDIEDAKALNARVINL